MLLSGQLDACSENGSVGMTKVCLTGCNDPTTTTMDIRQHKRLIMSRMTSTVVYLLKLKTEGQESKLV